MKLLLLGGLVKTDSAFSFAIRKRRGIFSVSFFILFLKCSFIL